MTAEQMDKPPEIATPLGRTMDRKPAPLARLVGAIGVSGVEWMKRGACRGSDPNIFFPVDEKGETEAKNICDDCTVRIDCLEYALVTGELHGVWGGATERERRRLRRQRRRTA